MSVWRKLYDFFLPPRCLLCGSLMLPQQDGTLCNACLQGIENHTGPVCVRCGIGFVSPAGRDRLCSSCRDAEPVFDTARSLGAYTGLLRQAIQDFKYRRKPFLGAPLGKLLSAYGMRVLPEREHRVLMPVPLHR
ncbi:MAG: ComF family protein, partial [Deltaproteobacteria bacterium]|nr:ComF family protein [Deltaproteobacteria bacterium]